MNNKKLNNAKEKAAKKRGFFKKWADRPTKQELRELKDYYKELTASIPDDTAMELMDSPDRWHFLGLLKIADFAELGKAFAIVTAFKLGYMAGKDGTEHEEN